jgi:uncharacterized protein YgiM (DUF1202 family)
MVAMRVASIEPLYERFRVLKRSNVRAGPDGKTNRIDGLGTGAMVMVTGRVATANWYRVRLDDQRTGYVYGTLIEKSEYGVKVAARPTAERKTADDARRRKALQARQAAEVGPRKQAKAAVARSQLETAELEEKVNALWAAEGAARAAADEARAVIAQAEKSAEEMAAAPGASATAAEKLRAQARERRSLADDARQAAIEAVSRNDEDAWRRFEAKAEAHLKAAYELEDAAQNRLREEEAVRARLSETTETLALAQEQVLEKEQEARTLAEEASQAALALEIARIKVTVAQRVAGLEVMNDWYLVRRGANVRAGPHKDADRVDGLQIGEKILVSGRVASANWYRIELGEDRVGYVFGSLIEKAEAAAGN